VTTTLDPGRELVVHWPSATPAVATLLKQVGAGALLTESLKSPVREACALAGVKTVAEVTASAGNGAALAAALRAAKDAGFMAAAVSAAGISDAAEFRRAIEASGLGDFIALVFLAPGQIGWDVSPAHAVLRGGLWPGIAPTSTEHAGASSYAWLDANTSLVAQLRALYPNRRAILGYRPDKDGGVPETRLLPNESVEVALADAFAAGGSVVLSLPGDYRRELLAGDSRAVSSWRSVAAVRAFVLAERAIADAPLAGHTAVLCGTIEQTGEILNLAFRKNLSPVGVPAASPPALSPTRFDIVVAANVAMTPRAVDAMVRFAAAGGAVLAAPSEADKDKPGWWTRQRGWKKTREEEGRDVYTAGRGVVYAYPAPIDDPGGFALDIRELAGQRTTPGIGVKNHDVRIWAADTVLGVLHRLSANSVAVVLTAYGNLPGGDFLVGVRGQYRRGTIRVVGGRGAPVPVKVMARPGRVEINLKKLTRSAILILEG
jgi:hypothetical protein